ncbi:MAG: heme exporter protein CcmD [Pseudomonadota bacterium]|nr:heme exporter protein CcmD [Pseudomonadota bacterium]
MNAAITEFFAMGGYAFYVWSAYGLAVLVFVYNAWIPARRHGRLRRSIQSSKRMSGAPSRPVHRIDDESSP